MSTFTYKKEPNTDNMVCMNFLQNLIACTSSVPLGSYNSYFLSGFKIAQTHSKTDTIASCILNRAIKPNLQTQLVKLMQTSFFILVTEIC